MQLRKLKRKRTVSWIIDYYDYDGKRQRYVLKDIKTQKNAELAFAEFQLKFERHQLDLPTEENLTLDAALDALVQDRKRNGCTDGWIENLGFMRTTVTNYFGEDRLFKSLNDDAMARYRDHRLKKDKRSVEMVNKELKVIIAAGHLAVRQKKIAKLPWQKVSFAMDRDGHEAWSYMKQDEITKLLHFLQHGGKATTKRKDPFKGEQPLTFDYPAKPKLWAIVTFLLNTGARRGEMFALRWRDVDMRTKNIRLVGSKLAKNGKSAPVRYIPMNAALEELFSILTRGGEHEQVFKYDSNLLRDFGLALKWAGLPHYRVHDLRHTFASHLAMSGTPLFTIGKLLGHATVQMTNRYAHLCPSTLATAVQSLRFTTPEPSPPQ